MVAFLEKPDNELFMMRTLNRLMTFHRKDRRQESLVNAVTPNSLDFNCVKGNPKLRIDWLHLENIMRSFT